MYLISLHEFGMNMVVARSYRILTEEIKSWFYNALLPYKRGLNDEVLTFFELFALAQTFTLGK